MMTLLLLFLPLVAALLVFASGDKLSSKLALGFAVIELAITAYALSVFYNEGAEAFYINEQWITLPRVSFHLAVDGLSMVLILLTNFLVPVIILSSFNRMIAKARSFFSLILLMQCVDDTSCTEE